MTSPNCAKDMVPIPSMIAIVNISFFIVFGFNYFQYSKFKIQDSRLFHHNLLDFHVVAVDEAEHVDARSGFETLAAATIDLLVAEEMSVDIHNLQGSLAIVVDDPVAVAEEREGVVGH